MKNQKGITLVALILVMIVLLILAGISVSLVVSQQKTNQPQNPVSSNTPILDEYEDNNDEEDNNVISGTVENDEL